MLCNGSAIAPIAHSPPSPAALLAAGPGCAHRTGCMHIAVLMSKLGVGARMLKGSKTKVGAFDFPRVWLADEAAMPAF